MYFVTANCRVAYQSDNLQDCLDQAKQLYGFVGGLVSVWKGCKDNPIDIAFSNRLFFIYKCEEKFTELGFSELKKIKESETEVINNGIDRNT